jgi:RNA polymerase sigma-70 factor (ECF subfamily)
MEVEAIHDRVKDEQAADQGGERVGAPVDEREDADDVLADVPGGEASGRLLLARPEFREEAGDPASAGTQVVQELRRSAAGTVGLRADFGAHLEANYQRLVAQLYAITLDPGEAHDVVQDAYSRAWRNWSTIGRSPDPSAWVRRVAVRSTVRSWRRTLARVGIGRPRGVGHGVDERTRAMLGALGRLSPGERRAVVLFHMAGASMGEIAALEQASVGTVQARLARARHVVTEGMAEVLPAVLGEAIGDGYEPADASGYGPDYDPAAYVDGFGTGEYGTGGYSVDRYGTGGYATGGNPTGGYADGYGYEPSAGDNEGERR